MHPKIGFYSPMPPAPTGIATYSAAVLEGLRRIGFVDSHRLDTIWPIEPKHEGLVPWYRLGIYQLGNNIRFHRDIYRFAMTAPGLIVLHDLALDDFVRGLRTAGDPLGFEAEREAGRLRDRIADPDILRNEPLRDPWCAHVARRSRGIIVHSDFGRRYLREFGCRTPVFVVPHPLVESEGGMRRAETRGRELRAPIEARGARTLVVAPGDLNEAKRLDAVLEAVARLGDDVHVALVGRRIEGYDIDRVVASTGLGQRVTLEPDVTDEDFRGWLFAADMVVDLRFPHRGEVSGSLARAMQAGRPAVVSATGTYLDVPGDTVLRVAPGPTDPAELAERIGELSRNFQLRTRMGAAAAEHMRGLRDSEATARGYEQAIDATLALIRDPARKAYARWAGALADVGVTEPQLARGYGLSYARAMESFRGAAVSRLEPDRRDERNDRSQP
jgi:glycosyltransferase involved in cell wall biosynthesis